LNLFTNAYKVASVKDTNSPVELLLANFLNDYMSGIKPHLLPPYLDDVFNYEAYSALLRRLFMKWQLLDEKPERPRITDKSSIEIHPTWKLLQTKFKLERILPTENGWKQEKRSMRKGIYHYLLVATSEISCKRIKISGKEKQLFEHLEAIPVIDFAETTKTIAARQYTFSWLKRLHRLGVIKISNK
jgi:hypothetical protein